MRGSDNEEVSTVAWTLSLPHIFYGRDREGGNDMMEALAVSVHENYFTFRGWADEGREIKPDGSLAERLCKNFATFRQWNG